MLAATLLAGCANGGYGPKQTVGALAGAGAGAFAGSKVVNGKQRIAAAAVGTLLGAFLGSELGKSLDRADELYAQKAQLQALEATPSGAQVAWRNPDSGNTGTVTPTRTYQIASGEYCREFQQDARIGGQSQKVYGTACRSPDGQWRAVE
jgi:surface antigen